MIEDPKNFDILTNENEKQVRLNTCNSCEQKEFILQDSFICKACACPIEYVVTYKFKQCPLNKWSID